MALNYLHNTHNNDKSPVDNSIFPKSKTNSRNRTSLELFTLGVFGENKTKK